MNTLYLNRDKAYEVLNSIKDPLLHAYLRALLVQLEISFVKINDTHTRYIDKHLPDKEFDFIFFMKVMENSYLNSRKYLGKICLDDTIPNDPMEVLDDFIR